MKHEETRQAFRPERIVTLFIGESVPKNGKFIYDGGTMMERHMEAGTSVPLAEFKARGWYIDDLSAHSGRSDIVQFAGAKSSVRRSAGLSGAAYRRVQAAGHYCASTIHQRRR